MLLDGNVEAEGQEFFSLGAFEVDHEGTRIAYAVDVEGDERFALRIKDIDTGEVLDDTVADIGYGVVWSLDGRYVFFTRLDDSWRPFQVWRHEVGTPAEGDVLVFEEDDARFWTGLGSSRDDRFILIASGSKLTTEIRLLDAATPLETPRVVAARREGVEYDVEPAGDRLLITHNTDNPDFDIAQAPLDATSPEQWTPFVASRPGERIVDVEAFAGHVVVSLRREGLTALRVLPRDASPVGLRAARELTFDEPLYSVGTGNNPEYDATALQVVFESLVTPRTISDYDVATGELTLLKRQPVLGGYDPAAYEQRREWATAPDGTRVPISLVYRRGVEPDGTAPGLLYGYGAYEITYDPYFSVARLSLLDRGFVYAMAHVRGGGEMGRRWYDDGKMDRKVNTFTDFIACADHLVETGWVAPDRLVAEGRFGRRPAHRRGRQHGSRPVPCGARRGAVRRRADHDPGPEPAADGAGVGGVGQPAARRGGLPLHALLHAVREHHRAGVPRDPRHDQPERHPGPLRRAGQVGGAAARDRDERPGGATDPAAHRDGGRARRPQRAVRRLGAVRLGARLPDGPGGRALTPGAWACTDPGRVGVH